MSRDTPQRQAIRRAIEAAGRPLSPMEVYESARRVIARLGLATVYRRLRELEQEGWLAAVELPGEPPRYERGGKEHHHHFQCRLCRRVYEVEGCGLSPARPALPRGFRVETHELTLHGVCAVCDAPTRRCSRAPMPPPMDRANARR
jgi:Fur family ferric uptake transcriptional regulator